MDIRQIFSILQAAEVDGIYIFEMDPPKYVRGRTSSVVGMVGEFERGPMGVKKRIGSSRAFFETFGGYGVAAAGEEADWDGYGGFKAIAGKVWAGGLRVVRPDYDSAAAASVDIMVKSYAAGPPAVQGRKLTLSAASEGRYGNRIDVSARTASDTSLSDGFALSIVLDDESQVVDNLYASMTTAELVERFSLAGVTLVVPEIADIGSGTKDSWPKSYDLSGGSDGTADAEAWTDAIDQLLADPEISILFVSEPPSGVTYATLNAHIKSAVLPTDGVGGPVFAVLTGDEGDDIDAAASAVASLRSDRIAYVWPWRKQVYSAAANTHEDGMILVPGNDVVAAALSAIGPGLDVIGLEATQIINACTSGLEFDVIDRSDYVTAKAAGICALEFDADLGYRCRTGYVTDLTPGKETIYRRRIADYLNWSIAAALKYFAGGKTTDEDWQDELTGAVTGFLDESKRLKLILNYSVDIDSVNTEESLARDLFYILMKVKLHGIARSLVLMSQVGTTVQIEESEGA